MKTPLRIGLTALVGLSLISFTTKLSAQVMRLGEPPSKGNARPPLWMNLKPSATTYYTPAQIRHAYGFDQLSATGAGQKIAIVDAYGSSSIQKDLNTFCTQFGLPTTTVNIYYAQKASTRPNTGWAQETTLDVEWAHAIAPDATIMLVIAKSSSFNDLLGAVDYAVSLGANVVSMSWGGSEFSSETSYDFHFNHSGVTFVASAGDNGESTGVEWPAASPYVVGVGGTTLSPDGSGGYTETAWSGSGGGISIYEASPAFQNGGFGNKRGVPDVSYVADPNTGVLVVYNGQLYVFGGTSVGAPQWSALIALSNAQRTTPLSADLALYNLAASSSYSTYYLDILSGNNGSDPDDFAGTGYDLVTGLGSPHAAALVPALVSP